jgi:hypothetical protein
MFFRESQTSSYFEAERKAWLSRYDIASAQAICPSNPSDVAMAR